MEEHKTFMHELNGGKGASIDTPMVPLVKFLNRMGVETVRSSAGYVTPKVDGPANVVLRSDSHKALVEVLFDQIQPMVAHLPSVFMEIMYRDGNWIGQLVFSPKDIDEISRRVGCWLEMLHK